MSRHPESTTADFESAEPERTLEVGSGGEPFFIKWADYPDLRKLMPESARATLVDIDHENITKIPAILKTKPGSHLNIPYDIVIANGLYLPFQDDKFKKIFLSDLLSYRIFPGNKVENTSEIDTYSHLKLDPGIELGNMKAIIAESRRVLEHGGKLIIANRAVARDQHALKNLQRELLGDESWTQERYIAFPQMLDNPARPSAGVWELTK